MKELGNIQSSLGYFKKFNIQKDARILDIGCNYGSLIHILQKLGYNDVYGIDINKKAIKQGKKIYGAIKNRLKTYDGQNIPFKKETFDVVLMFDVIEHIPNVQNFLKNEVYRVLKKEKSFIFQTPNKLTNIPWEILHQKSFTKWKEYHCSLQTYSSLTKLLKESRFKSIKLEKYDIKTEHNKEKIKARLGFFGVILLNLASLMPLRLQSNFWGSCKK